MMSQHLSIANRANVASNDGVIGRAPLYRAVSIPAPVNDDAGRDCLKHAVCRRVDLVQQQTRDEVATIF